jgi:DNA polymerase-4
MSRVILHSDLNCFYAAVEMMLHPELREKAIAVCGSTESRHGIVLAKSYPAKAKGVRTGMPKGRRGSSVRSSSSSRPTTTST